MFRPPAAVGFEVGFGVATGSGFAVATVGRLGFVATVFVGDALGSALGAAPVAVGSAVAGVAVGTVVGVVVG